MCFYVFLRCATNLIKSTSERRSVECIAFLTLMKNSYEAVTMNTTITNPILRVSNAKRMQSFQSQKFCFSHAIIAIDCQTI